MYSYIGIGYIIPIGSVRGFCAPRNVHLVIYIFALDICCQHLGNIRQLEGFCAPFRRKVKECTCCNIYVYLYIYFYWIYAAKIWRSYVSRIYTLLQGRTVWGPNCPPPKSGQLGPGQLGPGAQQSGAQQSGAQLYGAQLSGAQFT